MVLTKPLKDEAGSEMDPLGTWCPRVRAQKPIQAPSDNSEKLPPANYTSVPDRTKLRLSNALSINDETQWLG